MSGSTPTTTHDWLDGETSRRPGGNRSNAGGVSLCQVEAFYRLAHLLTRHPTPNSPTHYAFREAKRTGPNATVRQPAFSTAASKTEGLSAL